MELQSNKKVLLTPPAKKRETGSREMPRRMSDSKRDERNNDGTRRRNTSPSECRREGLNSDLPRRRNTSPSDSPSSLHSGHASLTSEVHRRREGRRVSFSNQLPGENHQIHVKRKGSFQTT